MPQGRFWSRASKLSALIVAAGPALLGQSNSIGTISGIVTNSSKEPIVGAIVRVDTGRGIKEGKTDGQGRYAFPQLLPGTVKVEVIAKDYSASSVQASVIANQNVTLNIHLAPIAATIVEVISVANPVVGINGATAMTGSNFTQEEISAFPVIGGVLDALLSTTPGAPSGGLNFHGSDDSANGFTVNGVESRSAMGGDQAIRLNRDLIEQISVLSGGVSAKYGRFVGASVATTTKTGGNEFSGTMRQDLTSESWNALPMESEYVTRERVPRHVADTQSYTFMGPIIKDTLFFTAGYQVQTPGVTKQVKGAVNSGLFPPFNFTSVSSNALKDIKLDWQINSDHRVYVSLNDYYSKTSQPTSGYSLSTLAVGSGATEYDTGMKSAGYTGILSPSLTLDVIISESLIRTKGTGSTGGANVVSWQDSMYGDWYDNGNTVSSNREEKIKTLGANLTWMTGNHYVEAGFQTYSSRIQSSGAYDYMGNPVTPSNVLIKFAGWVPNPTDMGRQNRVLIQDDIYQSELVVFDPLQGQFNSDVMGLYLNDTWTLNNHWTFNLGARYDSNQLKVAPEGHSFKVSTAVPRLSAAYDLHGDRKHVFSLGLAEYAGQIDAGTFTTISQANVAPSRAYAYYGSGIGSDALNVDGSINWNVWGNSPTTLGASNFVPPQQSSRATSVESNIKPPRAREASFSYRYTDPKQSLVATVLHKVQDNYIENKRIGAPGLGAGGQNAVGAQSVYWNDPGAKCRYESLEVQYRRQVIEDLSVSGNVTWSYTHANAGQGFAPGTRNQFGDFISNEVTSPMGYQPNQPSGATTPFTAHAISTYRHSFGKAGALTASLSGDYWSQSFQGYRSIAGLTDATIQDYGYSPIVRKSYTDSPLWWPERYSFNLHIGYDIDLWRKVKAFTSFDVLNVFHHVMVMGRNHYSALSDGTTLYGITLPDGTYNPMPAGWYNNPNLRAVGYNPPGVPWNPAGNADGEVSVYSNPRSIQLRVGLRF